MSDDLYALEKLVEAVDALVTGAGGVRERLFEAARFLIRIRPEDIPDSELRHTLTEIKRTLTAAPAEDDEGSITATLRAKSEDEAGTIARLIFDLYRELDRSLRE